MGGGVDDCGVVRVRGSLTAVLAPGQQLLCHVVMELTCQTRKCVGALGILPVTGSAWRNLGARDSLFIDFLALRHEFPWSPSQRLRIEISELCSEVLQHRLSPSKCHAAHH